MRPHHPVKTCIEKKRHNILTEIKMVNLTTVKCTFYMDVRVSENKKEEVTPTTNPRILNMIVVGEFFKRDAGQRIGRVTVTTSSQNKMEYDFTGYPKQYNSTK